MATPTRRLITLAAASLTLLPALSVPVADTGSTALANDLANDGAKAARRRPRAPRVRRITPRHRSILVPVETDVRIRFTRPIDPVTVTRFTVKLKKISGEEVPWTFELTHRDRVLTLRPQQTLDPGTDYRVTVLQELRGANGVNLRRERNSLFYTKRTIDPFANLHPNQFTQLTSEMSIGRAAHTATLVGGGAVLLAGGHVDQFVLSDTADLFDPVTMRFSPVGGRMAEPRAFHPAVATTTSTWQVGGWNGSHATRSVDAFSGGAFFAGPSMQEERDFHAVAALAGGKVLVTGGLSYTPDGAFYSDTAEIYDPTDGSFRLTLGNPIARRAGHTATVLPDGTVLIAGGIPSGGSASSAEIFDPLTETFRETLFRPNHHRQLHTATLLDDGGSVLLADGGSATIEIFELVSERFLDAGGTSFVTRTRATATLLPDGNVLLAGGFESRGSSTLILSGMDLFRRDVGIVGAINRTSVVFPQPRAGHTATTLRDGRVLFAGGFGSDDSLSSAVLFTPDED